MSTRFGQWYVFSGGFDVGPRLGLDWPFDPAGRMPRGAGEAAARDLYCDLRSAINHAWPHGPPLNARTSGPPCTWHSRGCLNQASIVCACGLFSCPTHAKHHLHLNDANVTWWEVGSPCRVSTE